jgi:hypothetical protein
MLILSAFCRMSYSIQTCMSAYCIWVISSSSGMRSNTGLV